ncbi:protein spaetzle-like [Copidosoma floridanum]|uniref:protein spaetzle-like n=1 Tax=Copidosoma floridanum TaxID=29053 RepID=UPI0006C9A807|nr:protein spaetzle-like [Copidosoma floridanum]
MASHWIFAIVVVLSILNSDGLYLKQTVPTHRTSEDNSPKMVQLSPAGYKHLMASLFGKSSSKPRPDVTFAPKPPSGVEQSEDEAPTELEPRADDPELEYEEKTDHPVNSTLEPIMGADCDDQTLCEASSVINYPDEAVQSALRKNRHLMLMPANDIIRSGMSLQAFTDNPDEISLCNKIERIVYPRAAKNIYNKWQFVINTKYFRQGIRVELCTDTESPCRFLDSLPVGYKSKCRQNFIYRQLLTLNGANLEMVAHRVPVSCSCYCSASRGKK